MTADKAKGKAKRMRVLRRKAAQQTKEWNQIADAIVQVRLAWTKYVGKAAYRRWSENERIWIRGLLTWRN